MNLTEEKVFEAFGLEMPAEPGKGENKQEAAAPAAQTEPTGNDEGAREQSVAASAGDEPGTDPASGATAAEAEGDEPHGADGGGEPGTEPQTIAQRRENAARRRQQEQQTAIDQAVQAALQAERERNDTVMQEFFAKAGLKNSFTGETIKSIDEFNKWQQEFQRQQLEQQLQSGKLTAESLQAAIGAHPAVQQAQRMMEQNADRLKQEQEAQHRAKIEAEIAEIGKVDPSIRGVEDLLKMPNAKEFYELVRRGYSFRDAHYVLNREKIETARAEAIRQQAMNNAQSKDHLKANAGSRGSGAVAVPDGDMKWFRAFNPNASDAEIQAFYNKFQKQ